MPRSEKKRKRAKSLRKKPYEMTEVGKTNIDEFALTGRTGRRNALPDIMDDKYSQTSTAGMTLDFDTLHCSEEGKLPEASGGTSGSGSTEKPSSGADSKKDSAAKCKADKADSTAKASGT